MNEYMLISFSRFLKFSKNEYMVIRIYGHKGLYEDHPRHMELRKALSALCVCGSAQSEGPSAAQNGSTPNSSWI